MDLRQLARKVHFVFPKLAPIGSTEGGHREADFVVQLRGPRPTDRSFSRGCRIATLNKRRMVSTAQRARADLIRYEDPIAPHHWRGDAETRERGSPCNILSAAPFNRQSLLRRNAGPGRTAPLRPVLAPCG